VSASRWVGSDEVPHLTRLTDRTVGFEYVQGAGDDEESWGRGLKVGVWWREHDLFLNTDKEDLLAVIAEVVEKHQRVMSDEGGEATQGASVEFVSVSNRLVLDLGKTIIPAGSNAITPGCVWRVLQVDKAPRDCQIIARLTPDADVPAQFLLFLPNPRSDGKGYLKALQYVMAFLERSPQVPLLLQPGTEADIGMVNGACRNGDDPPKPLAHPPLGPSHLSEIRKVILPLALVILCSDENVKVDKAVIARQLHRLVALWPDGNPPRVSLKRVNEYFMSGDMG
jgi:tRNA A64-2'-O-ribosylphosphate transferase